MLGAIAQGAGSLFGSVLGFIGTNNAAKKQLAATQETNKTNLQIAREQRDWEYRMQQEQNAYNSLAAQRARAEDAGFSPYILGGSNSYMQSSLPSYQAPQMQTPSYDLEAAAAQQLADIPNNVINGVLSAVNASKAFQESQKVGAERQAVDIENQYRTQSILLDLENKKEESKSKRSQRLFTELQTDILGAQKKAKIQRASLENELIASQANKEFANEMYLRSMQSLNAKQYKWLDQEKRLALSQTAAEIGYLSAQKHLSEAQTKMAVQNAIMLQLQQIGVKWDNESKKVAATYSEFISDEQLRQMRKVTERLGKEVDWFDYNQYLNGIKSMPSVLLPIK